MITVMRMRLKLMYGGWSVRILAVLIVVLIVSLMNGLYAGSEDASKLRISVHFEKPSALTEEILASLNDTDILIANLMTYEEGILAVKESRVQGLFVFKEDFEEEIDEGSYKELVDLYFLDENYLPYLLTDIVGSKIIGEIALKVGLQYIEDALEEAEFAPDIDLYEGLYSENKENLHFEKDNFFVEKNLIAEDGSRIDYIALNNVVIFRQVLLGVIYIFLTFYMMFLGVNSVRDHEVGLGERWQLTKLRPIQIYLGDYLAIIIGTLPLISVISVLQCIYEEGLLYYSLVNLLFVIAYAGLLFLLGKFFGKVTVYVLVTTGIILLLGIVSGSFFALDTSQSLVRGMSFGVPTYHLLQEIVASEAVNRLIPSTKYVLYMISFAFCTWVLAYIGTRKRRY